ncbi:hypothetical protein VTN96DRAFT_4020 [Rasamsonia emersonii]
MAGPAVSGGGTALAAGCLRSGPIPCLPARQLQSRASPELYPTPSSLFLSLLFSRKRKRLSGLSALWPTAPKLCLAWTRSVQSAVDRLPYPPVSFPAPSLSLSLQLSFFINSRTPELDDRSASQVSTQLKRSRSLPALQTRFPLASSKASSLGLRIFRSGAR